MGSNLSVNVTPDVLTTSVLSGLPLQNAAAATPTGMVTNKPTLPSLPPFEPGDCILWTLEQGVQNALGPDGWKRLEAVLPREHPAQLLEGLLEGAIEAVQDIVVDRLKAIRDAIGVLIDFYSLAFDLKIWVQMLAVWIQPEGTGLGDFGSFMQAEHPDLWQAMLQYGGFSKKFEGIFAPLANPEQEPSMPWSIAMRAISDWLIRLPLTFGAMLRPQFEMLVANRGNARVQGQIIGRVATRVIVEVVLVAMDLYNLVRGAAGLASSVLAGVREAVVADELTKVAAYAEHVAPGVAKSGAGIASSTEKEVFKIYQELTDDIKAYKVLHPRTGAFNRDVRDIWGLGKFDTEYISIRLDAHHIIEDTWYNKFPNEFKNLLGWNSSEDMDAIAIHTEWHIRSGARLSASYGLQGAEKEVSLTKALQDSLTAKQTGPGGKFVPFKTLKQLFEANAEFYQKYSPRLWTRLKPWFDDKLKLL